MAMSTEMQSEGNSPSDSRLVAFAGNARVNRSTTNLSSLEGGYLKKLKLGDPGDLHGRARDFSGLLKTSTALARVLDEAREIGHYVVRVNFEEGLAYELRYNC